MSGGCVTDVLVHLERRRECEAALKAALLALPHGRGRHEALRACVAAGISQGALSRMLGVSRQRVFEMVHAEEREA